MKKLLRIGGLLIAVSIALGVLLRVLLVPSAPSGDGPSPEQTNPNQASTPPATTAPPETTSPRRRPRRDRRSAPALRPPRNISSRGSRFLDTGRLKEARSAFQKVLELDPGNARAKTRLSLLEEEIVEESGSTFWKRPAGVPVPSLRGSHRGVGDIPDARGTFGRALYRSTSRESSRRSEGEAPIDTETHGQDRRPQSGKHRDRARARHGFAHHRPRRDERHPPRRPRGSRAVTRVSSLPPRAGIAWSICRAETASCIRAGASILSIFTRAAKSKSGGRSFASRAMPPFQRWCSSAAPRRGPTLSSPRKRCSAARREIPSPSPTRWSRAGT